MTDTDRAQGFWGFLIPEDRAALAQEGRARLYKAGDALCSQGDLPEHVIVIRRGWAKVTAVSRNGHEAVLAVRTTGDIIGESGMLRDRRRCASVYALSTVEAIVLPTSWLWNYFKSHSEAMAALAQASDERRDLADQSAITRASRGGAARQLAGLLIELVTRYPIPRPDGAIEIAPPLAQHHLAAWTGYSRTTINEIFARWKDAGILTTGRCQIIITDPDALTALAEND